MPVRPLFVRSFFDPEFASPGCLLPGSLPWVLARGRSKWFPAWLFADWRGNRRRGRDAWPSVVLMTLVLLRWSEEGMSRRAAVRRAKTDVAWRAAMGLALGAATPSERTLRDFERFLQARHRDTQVPRYLLAHEHIVRSCLDAGVVGKNAAWAMDSTPMWCYGAVRDTVRLLGDGLRVLANLWCRATGCSLAEVAKSWQAPFLLKKSTKGAFSVDWSKASESAGVITQLAERVVDAVTYVRRNAHADFVRAGMRKTLLEKCRHLMRVVANDLETDPHGGLAVAERVAADRLVSITDPQARHGRKSKSHTFNGFKTHLLGDVISGLIVSVAVTRGNMHDGEPAHRLIARAKKLHAELDQVLADTAYGGARLRHLVKSLLGVELLAPPPPVPDKDGSLCKRSFVIDFEGRKATCSNNVTTDDFRFFWSADQGVHAPLFVWSKKSCDVCPLSQACRGKEKGGRRLQLHPYERELRAAREAWKDPRVRQAYRARTQCERLVNQVTRYGGRRARAFGLRNAQLQAHSIVAAANLRLLAKALAAKAGDQMARAA